MKKKAGWKSKLTPELQKILAEGTQTRFRVLVEITGEPTEVINFVKCQEGTIIRETPCMAMLTMEISPTSLVKLARLDTVKMIRKDAPVNI